MNVPYVHEEECPLAQPRPVFTVGGKDARRSPVSPRPDAAHIVVPTSESVSSEDPLITRRHRRCKQHAEHVFVA